MLEAGEDPLYVARRIIRFAVEDVGPRRPAALARRARGLARPSNCWAARGRARPRPARRLPRPGAEVERRSTAPGATVRRDGRRAPGRAGAARDPQRADRR